ncbi:C1 family peptidase [Cellulosimicrobium aquatile]|uniref:C1 family peptidase n=1 Tax=Cellulosimicrobium aquatile TaxID=1612203 RepID=UPI00145934FD|nr:C1 family peptidase [Cellulosimicrobium aquatile]NMF28841.1 hypothetical protein [Cellulosimicrobium aquatile]
MAMTSAAERISAEELSAEYLHWASGRYPGGRGTVSAAGTALSQDGHPPREQWPYDPSIDETDPSYAPPGSVIGPYAHKSVHELSDLDAIVKALAEGRWVVVGLRVTDAFAAAGTGVVLPDGTGRAGHAVVAVAAALVTTNQLAPAVVEGERLLCVRNSWGQGWGSNGHKLVTEAALRECMITAIALVPADG